MVPSLDQSCENIRNVLAQIEIELPKSSHTHVTETLEQLKVKLNLLLNRLKEIPVDSSDIENEISHASCELMEAKSYLTPEYLCGIPEEEWDGCVPPSLVLMDIPYEVRQGQGGWECSNQLFDIRGPSYLYDNVKVASQAPLFHMRGVQMVGVNELRPHIALEPWTAFPKEDDGNEWLILNYMVPGRSPFQMICYYTASKEAKRVISPTKGDSTCSTDEEQPTSEGWENCLRKFWEADQEYCDARFKIIPNVASGPWLVRMAVGNKPALTGMKVKQLYTRGDRFFEVDMDIGSSAVAARVLGLVRDFCSVLTVDVGVTIEGQSDEELPERVLCRMQWKGVDFSKAQPLDR
mmetsp:Transcript_20061/g.28829  ORF Transcript_20061/g.28829 Transcript_20061/m.28829 type:complete len:350 (+) Transcript_20061:155-1204(+)|eukprot:CAMPEP_0185028874 /NCGR_PEP_ID=MMETSP1103-20130426/14934_1 /TAXON_ID=36769 /ORGANISM="Paraphysomonas bandaiensis, Strain Caron Lab Isolate" /LENGTH=349 /DNA_ID=CAMNT_0027563437 /DNA_START=79 /DNA_END=1128 /DNA_ORIENTATION=+